MGNCFPQLWHQWVPEEPDPSHQSIIFSGSETMGCCPVQWMGRRARERLNYNSCWVKVTFIIVALTPDNYKSSGVVAPIIIKTGLQLLIVFPSFWYVISHTLPEESILENWKLRSTRHLVVRPPSHIPWWAVLTSLGSYSGAHRSIG